MEEEIEKDNGRDMTPQLIGETWRKYPTEKSKYRYKYGLYKCAYCGKEFETLEYSVRSGATKSCGCLVTKHGISRHRFYKTWGGMMHRCTNQNQSNYKSYGERGIKVCKEWLDVTAFVSWAERTHPNTEGYSLDRIDNSLGYSPENCRWVDKTTQVINRGIMKNNISGFVGIKSSGKKWSARIRIFNKDIWVGSYNTKEEAVQARDQYILDNNLPNKLSTDYKREES